MLLVGVILLCYGRLNISNDLPLSTCLPAWPFCHPVHLPWPTAGHTEGRWSRPPWTCLAWRAWTGGCRTGPWGQWSAGTRPPSPWCHNWSAASVAVPCPGNTCGASLGAGAAVCWWQNRTHVKFTVSWRRSVGYFYVFQKMYKIKSMHKGHMSELNKFSS